MTGLTSLTLLSILSTPQQSTEMVVSTRRKTCFVSSTPFENIIEDRELSDTDTSRDSAERDEAEVKRCRTRGNQWENPMDGEFTQISTNNYEAFLAKIGAGPFSTNMVMRARIRLIIKEVRREVRERF